MPKSKRVRKSPRKTATANSASCASDNEETQSNKWPKARRIHWNIARTEQLLDWLEENPEERQKLFSKDAKDEGQCKHQAKSPKSEFHKMIAAFVFSADPDTNICADFQSNPTNYAKSVDNYIIQWVLLFILHIFHMLILLLQIAERIPWFQHRYRADRCRFTIWRYGGREHFKESCRWVMRRISCHRHN